MTDFPIMAANGTSPPQVWNQIAKLHVREIPDGFLATLGVRFLARLYAAIARSESAFLLTATNPETGEIAGFICGSTDPRRLLGDCILRSGRYLIFPLLHYFFKWKTMVKLLETVKYAGRSGEAFPQAEILNFCVRADFQGIGVGQCLFRALKSEFKRRGAERITIVTGQSQMSAQRFYYAAQARRAGDVNIHGNVRSVVFVYEIG